MWMLPYGLADGHALLLEEVAEVLQLVAHVAHRRAGKVPLALLGGPGWNIIFCSLTRSVMSLSNI